MTFPVSRKPMAEVIRTFDWSTTPLGPLAQWPVALRVVVNLLLESDFPKAIAWGPDLITIHNDAFIPILGAKPPAIGRPFSEVWSEAWETIGPIAEKAFSGESTFIENFPLTVERGEAPEQAYFTFCYSPIRGEDGTVLGMMDTVVETTSAVVARQTGEVLRRELIHRVKNMLAVASSVVSSTLRHADTVEDAETVVTARLAALAAAQELSLQPGEATDVAALVRQTIAPHIGDEWHRVCIKGHRVLLEDNHITALSLVLYELATNAAKYGALSTGQGSIDIQWQTNEAKEFRFNWVENGTSGVTEPMRKGFGSRLTTRIAPAYFGGTAERTFSPTGFRYSLEGRLGAG